MPDNMAKKKRNNNKKGKKFNAASKAALDEQPLTTDIVENNECNVGDIRSENIKGFGKPAKWRGAEVSPNINALFKMVAEGLKNRKDSDSDAKGIVANMTKEEEKEWFKKMGREAEAKDLVHMVKIGLLQPEEGFQLTDEQKHERQIVDEALFQEHMTPDDCAICAVPLPIVANEKTYKVCCGVVICDGCIDAMRDSRPTGAKGDLCPFCRVNATTSNLVSLVEKRVALNDPHAFMVLSSMYRQGVYGMPKDEDKGLEMMKKAAELGLADALCNLGNFYYHGDYLVEKDVPKSKFLLELASIKGSIEARYFLGCYENTKTTLSRGVKHFLISARAGYEPSLKAVKNCFRDGLVTKDEYEEALRAYQLRVDDMKSEQRHRIKLFKTDTDDEALFKEPPPRKKCPVCCLTLPFGTGATYNICCGTNVCGGCSLVEEFGGYRPLCITCGARTTSDDDMDEFMKRVKKRMDLNDAEAFNALGCLHNTGNFGLRFDKKKAIELWTRAGEIGSGAALGNLAVSYKNGEGVTRDRTKARYYYEQAAINGDAVARHNLGCDEGAAGNHDRAVKHFVIAAKAGVPESMKSLRKMFMKGDSCISKDLFEKTLRAHHDAATEMRSKQRDKAASYLAQGLGTSVPLDKVPVAAMNSGSTKKAKGKKTKA